MSSTVRGQESFEKGEEEREYTPPPARRACLKKLPLPARRWGSGREERQHGRAFPLPDRQKKKTRALPALSLSLNPDFFLSLSSVPIRTVGDQAYRLRDLALRFVDGGSTRPAVPAELRGHPQNRIDPHFRSPYSRSPYSRSPIWRRRC